MKNTFKWMDNLIDKWDCRSHFLHQNVATPEKLQNKKQGFSQFYPLALYCEKWPKMAKNGQKWPSSSGQEI